jgi:hypothetical protein
MQHLCADAVFLSTLNEWLDDLVLERSDANLGTLHRLMDLVAALGASTWAALNAAGLVSTIKAAAQHRDRDVAQRGAAIAKVGLRVCKGSARVWSVAPSHAMAGASVLAPTLARGGRAAGWPAPADSLTASRCALAPQEWASKAPGSRHKAGVAKKPLPGSGVFNILQQASGPMVPPQAQPQEQQQQQPLQRPQQQQPTATADDAAIALGMDADQLVALLSEEAREKFEASKAAQQEAAKQVGVLRGGAQLQGSCKERGHADVLGRPLACAGSPTCPSCWAAALRVTLPQAAALAAQMEALQQQVASAPAAAATKLDSFEKFARASKRQQRSGEDDEAAEQQQHDSKRAKQSSSQHKHKQSHHNGGSSSGSKHKQQDGVGDAAAAAAAAAAALVDDGGDPKEQAGKQLREFVKVCAVCVWHRCLQGVVSPLACRGGTSILPCLAPTHTTHAAALHPPQVMLKPRFQAKEIDSEDCKWVLGKVVPKVLDATPGLDAAAVRPFMTRGRIIKVSALIDSYVTKRRAELKAAGKKQGGSGGSGHKAAPVPA